MKQVVVLTLMATLLFGSVAIAQIPVELFAGDKKTSLDLMFFKYFKNKEAANSNLLLFNRNRVNMDYKQTATTHLPVFGFTEAISFNHPKLKGFAPVLVAQISNNGIYPKAGVQYFHRTNDFTFFSWLVCETLNEPNVDFFVLTRFEPKLTNKLNLFAQVEFVNAFPTESTNPYNLIQRVRIGIKVREWQFGAGADFQETGNNTLINTTNLGGFLRHEF